MLRPAALRDARLAPPLDRPQGRGAPHRSLCRVERSLSPRAAPGLALPRGGGLAPAPPPAGPPVAPLPDGGLLPARSRARQPGGRVGSRVRGRAARATPRPTGRD